MPKLGVNIDHIATVRQARRGVEPDPVEGAAIAEEAGCDSIVAHLRADRRHINDDDVRRLRKTVRTRFNLEMSCEKEIVDIAARIKPDQATLVPEKRMELTTEGGLDLAKNEARVGRVVEKLKKHGISVSLFIDPVEKQIRLAGDLCADSIELHTGEYANAKTRKQKKLCLRGLSRAAEFGMGLGLAVNAGHGLTYRNVRAVALIKGLEELNIGHSIISRALVVGLERAVKEMIKLIR